MKKIVIFFEKILDWLTKAVYWAVEVLDFFSFILILPLGLVSIVVFYIYKILCIFDCKVNEVRK